MKYAIVLPDGAADEPVEALGGRTPLEAANKPHIDWIAGSGEQGLVVTVPAGFSPGSDVATLSLFGYDPAVHYPGRAPLEAAAQRIAVGPGDTIFRCNFVTLVDGSMRDFTAGHISSQQAARRIAILNEAFASDNCRFHAGVSYRNLLVVAGIEASQLRCTPPHDIPDRPTVEYLPRGEGSTRVREIMARAHEVLAKAGEEIADHAAATDIWLWGQGRAAALPTFRSRFGVSGAVIAAVDLIRGIAECAGLSVIDVPGATGYLDTDYAAKGRAACEALRSFDLVAVHVEAPDEAGHLGKAAEKVRSLEQIDEHVIGPLLETLKRLEAWRILVAPDHPTPVETRVHSAAPPPFCIAGTGISSSGSTAFSEQAARSAGLRVERGYELMGRFITR